MYILYDYKCTMCSLKFESLEKRDTATTECILCGEPADKLISPVRCKLDPHGDFPGASMKWDAQHR